MKDRIGRIKAALMSGLNFFASFLQQATAQGTRSTILTPLGWFFAMSVGGLLIAVRWGADFWIQVMLGIFAILGAVSYLGTHIFCLATKQPNLLQTEKFLIQQLELEKRFRGDSVTGIVIDQPSLSPGGSVTQIGNGSEQQ